MAPALALAVWRSGAPWFEAQAGWLDPRSPSTPVSSETLFDLASLTKPITATAFLRLVSDKRVRLDDRVVDVVPEFGGGLRGVDGGQEPLSRRMLAVPVERADWAIDPTDVTFRQLLTHTSGLAPWRAVFRETGPPPPPPERPDPLAADSRWAAGLEAVLRSPFVARPGEEFHYSDLGFIVLGEALRRIAGEPLEAAISTLVGEPLGLDSLTFAPLRWGRSRTRVAPTSLDDDWRGRRCWGEVEDENAAGLGGVAGHAGLFATAGDVARFGAAWLGGDPRLGLGAQGAAAVADQTPGKAASRGLGWQVQPTDHLAPLGPRAYGHTGFTGTSIAVDPDVDLVVVLLTNRVYASRTHGGCDELRLALHEAVAAVV